ncbi:MAG TPA: hypothetical protein VGG48_03475 [Rhizomicrobium sp.]|jgi:hypothetical protein
MSNIISTAVVATIFLASNACATTMCPGNVTIEQSQTAPPFQTNNPNWHTVNFAYASYSNGGNWQIKFAVTFLQFTQAQAGSYVEFRICVVGTNCADVIATAKVEWQGQQRYWITIPASWQNSSDFGASFSVEWRTDSTNTMAELMPDPDPIFDNSFALICTESGGKKSAPKSHM